MGKVSQRYLSRAKKKPEFLAKTPAEQLEAIRSLKKAHNERLAAAGNPPKAKAGKATEPGKGTVKKSAKAAVGAATAAVSAVASGLLATAKLTRKAEQPAAASAEKGGSGKNKKREGAPEDIARGSDVGALELVPAAAAAAVGAKDLKAGKKIRAGKAQQE